MQESSRHSPLLRVSGQEHREILKVGCSTVHRMVIYRVVRRWVKLKGVRDVDLRAVDIVRRMQENPKLDAFRMKLLSSIQRREFRHKRG